MGNFGGRFLVEDIARVLRDGYESREENRHSCVPKGSIKAYCGDYVLFRRPILEGEGDGVVYRVIPRENIFQRSDKQCRGGLEAVCSNVDQICVVVTVRPNMNAFLVDRILSQAMRMGAGACIVLNKVDLIPELLQAEAHTSQRAFENFTQALVETEVILTDFQRIGYPVIRTSAVTGEGVQDLVQFLAGASEASVQAREMGQRGQYVCACSVCTCSVCACGVSACGE